MSSSSSSPTSSSSTTASPTSTTDASSTGSSADPSIASANYFFGFVVTFVVLLLLFIGCGLGSWRRFRIIGTAWDARLQGVDEGPFGGRKRGRRKLVRPVFRETWLFPKLPTNASSWEGVQPISAAFLWSRSRLGSYKAELSSSSPQTSSSRRNSPSPGWRAKLISFVNPRRPSHSDHPPKPPRPVEWPQPDTVQVAVMISMPTPSSSTYGQAICGSVVGEYEIGVMQLPWPSNLGVTMHNNSR